MIHSFTVTFGTKYLTGMVTNVPLYKNFSFIKNNILRQPKIYKNPFENSNFWGITYSFINMLFISTGIFYDKLRPQILSVGTTANFPSRQNRLMLPHLRRQLFPANLNIHSLGNYIWVSNLIEHLLRTMLGRLYKKWSQNFIVLMIRWIKYLTKSSIHLNLF
jgi:hypothetical protein